MFYMAVTKQEDNSRGYFVGLATLLFGVVTTIASTFVTIYDLF